jgi:hypothetical protein
MTVINKQIIENQNVQDTNFSLLILINFQVSKYILQSILICYAPCSDRRGAGDLSEQRGRGERVCNLMRRLAYWQLLPKQGCSNLQEQKELIRPVTRFLKDIASCC